MKRIYGWISILMIVGVGIIGASAYKSFYYDEKQEVTQAIDHYLKQQKYMTHVKNKDIRYDTSTGEFFARVVFQDEPKNEYTIYQAGSSHIKVTGYKDGVQITNKQEGRYISED
ncbi:hypothetical protein ADM98_09350 [Exiguobacterium sp. BMC-KP]|uniref:DUF3139 domain-containing protein n=1 Tax=Exiguobacterium sp. BMC-KP TaxID=1684312 RepID=UPI0006AA506F|nr:DUF3139 domain-containing protein [Exiguobacterium sp. BMC-KP]KOP29107.1 hypothetical protein ADM98_09350 [Exiguobacterium sp. BMC-KP]